MPKGRVAIIADISGHLNTLNHHCSKLGVSLEENYVPEDLTLIFNGDMVHRGPDSDKIVSTLQKLKKAYPERVILIAGNHETLYIDDPYKTMKRTDMVNKESAKIIKEWWESNQLEVGVGVDTPIGPVLITHGGLTIGLWSYMNSPETLKETVKGLQELKESNDLNLWKPGVRRSYNTVSNIVGPFWPACVSELYKPWLNYSKNNTTPYSQLHGHTAPINWRKNQWWEYDEEIDSRTVYNRKSKHSHTVIGGRYFIAIDPDHSNKPVEDHLWKPYLLTDSRITASVKTLARDKRL